MLSDLRLTWCTKPRDRSHSSLPGVSFSFALGNHMPEGQLLGSRLIPLPSLQHDPPLATARAFRTAQDAVTVAVCQLIRPRSAHPLYFTHVPVSLLTGHSLRERCSRRSSVCAANIALPRRPQPAPVRSCCFRAYAGAFEHACMHRTCCLPPPPSHYIRRGTL